MLAARMPFSLPFLRRKKDDDHNIAQNQNQNQQQQQQQQLAQDEKDNGDGEGQQQQQHDSHAATAQQRPRSSLLRARLFRAALYFLAFILLVLVETGSTRDAPVLRNGYFLVLDLSDIIPRTVPDARLINSIARSIGLHDFYQVGLWNFCEGYEDGSGITYCANPRPMYAFNPIDILLQELLAGATIALPADIMRALDIARIASQTMFVLFLLAVVLVFLSFVLSPLAVPTTTTTTTDVTTTTSPPKKTPLKRLFRVTILLLTLAAFLSTLTACTVATALFTIFRIVFANAAAAELNVRAELGVSMLVYMWLAVAVVLVGFILHCRDVCRNCCGVCCGWCCCCCAGRSRKPKKARGFTGVTPVAPRADGDAGEKNDAEDDNTNANNNSHGSSSADANTNGAKKQQGGALHRLGRLRL